MFPTFFPQRREKAPWHIVQASRAGHLPGMRYSAGRPAGPSATISPKSPMRFMRLSETDQPGQPGVGDAAVPTLSKIAGAAGIARQLRSLGARLETATAYERRVQTTVNEARFKEPIVTLLEKNNIAAATRQGLEQQRAQLAAQEADLQKSDSGGKDSIGIRL